MFMARKVVFAFLLMWIGTVFSGALAAETACIVPGRGFFRVHAGAGGLFGAFAHDHLIEAGKIEGCAAVDLQNLAQSSVKLSFSAAELRVVDPKESAEDRAKVQKTMEAEVLRLPEYPKITFESTGVTTDSGSQVSSEWQFDDSRESFAGHSSRDCGPARDGTYKVTGTFKFKQTTFGIQPVSLVGGTIRVKDELETEWELFLSEAGNPLSSSGCQDSPPRHV